MLRKSTLLAVAASAALGLAMLSPISASAHGGGGHGGGGHGGGMHGGGHGGGGHWGGHGHGGHVHFRPNYRFRYVHYHRPIWYPRPVVYTVARPITPGPCTCLTKEYTPEGAVLFKDRCTNEAAMNPPAIEQQSSEAVPQQAPVVAR